MTSNLEKMILNKNLLCRKYTTPNRPHSHNMWELIFFEKGETANSVNDVEYTANPGDVFLIGPPHTHAITFRSTPPASRFILHRRIGARGCRYVFGGLVRQIMFRRYSAFPHVVKHLPNDHPSIGKTGISGGAGKHGQRRNHERRTEENKHIRLTFRDRFVADQNDQRHPILPEMAVRYHSAFKFARIFHEIGGGYRIGDVLFPCHRFKHLPRISRRNAFGIPYQFKAGTRSGTFNEHLEKHA